MGAMEAARDAQAKEMHKLRHDIAERPKLKTQLYRIVVIGMRSTGKTSLILKWANPTWEVRNPPGATLFNKFMRTVSSVFNARSNVVVNHVFEIFDFGGERIVEAQETLVVDDIQDAATERRGAPPIHAMFGLPVALNAANAAYFRALSALKDVLPDTLRLRALDMLSQELFNAHLGQALDLSLGAVLKAGGIAVRAQLPPGAYLELFVKVDKDWQRRPKALERLGY